MPSDHLIERAAARLRDGRANAPGAPAPDDAARRARPPSSTPAATAAPSGVLTVAEPPAEIDLGALERAGLVVGRMTRTRISEEFRVAVGRIARSRPAEGAAASANVLMVTSARPGEGKTFTALNLAAALAQAGPRRVVLADLDNKRQSLTALLELSDRRGALDLGEDPARDPRALAITTEVAGLAFLPVGQTSPDDAGLGQSRMLGSAVERIAERFSDRLIVLDTPPCLSTSDPSMLAGHVARAIMVVEAERTQRNEVEAAIDFIRACPDITILLNKTRLNTRHTFGAYDYLGSYQ